MNYFSRYINVLISCFKMYFSTFIERRCGRAEVLYPAYVSHLTGWHFSAGLASPFYLNFRVRFFISDPNSLQHEQTRLVHVLLCHECCCYVERLSDSERSLFAGMVDKNENLLVSVYLLLACFSSPSMLGSVQGQINKFMFLWCGASSKWRSKKLQPC